MQQPCWRVGVRFYRQDMNGLIQVVSRTGPIIAANSSDEAVQKAESIFTGCLDYAGVGFASYLHTGHRALLPISPTELRPAQSPDLSLEESMVRMVSHIRSRARRKGTEVERLRAGEAIEHAFWDRMAKR